MIKEVDQLSLYAINPAGYLVQMGFSVLKESGFRGLGLPEKTFIVPLCISFLFPESNFSFYSDVFDQV